MNVGKNNIIGASRERADPKDAELGPLFSAVAGAPGEQPNREDLAARNPGTASSEDPKHSGIVLQS